jgi:hypothetical protein
VEDIKGNLVLTREGLKNGPRVEALILSINHTQRFEEVINKLSCVEGESYNNFYDIKGNSNQKKW